MQTYQLNTQHIDVGISNKHLSFNRCDNILSQISIDHLRNILQGNHWSIVQCTKLYCFHCIVINCRSIHTLFLVYLKSLKLLRDMWHFFNHYQCRPCLFSTPKWISEYWITSTDIIKIHSEEGLKLLWQRNRKSRKISVVMTIKCRMCFC